MAHTLGNPFPVAEVAELAERARAVPHRGQLRRGRLHATTGKLTGTFGDLCTVSFYPAHHLTMGEGGCVLTGNLALARIVESMRDWGRDCWCEPGEDNKCLKRFDYQLGDAAARVRPQVHLLARRVQPEGDRPAGGAGADPADEAAAVLRRAPAQLAAAARRPRRRARPAAARGHPGQRPELVRLRHHGAAGRRVHPQRAGGLPGGAADRHPPAVRGQPDPAPGVPGRAVPDRPAS